MSKAVPAAGNRYGTNDLSLWLPFASDARDRRYIEKMKCSHAEVELISSGSSIKICLVAEGKADVYPRFAPTMEWDTAAGHAIARAAGMEIYQVGKEEPLQYNKEDLLNPWFIVEPKHTEIK